MLVHLPEPISISTLHKKFTLGFGQINQGETLVSSFASSSNDVKPGTLFIACRGVGVDGHSFIDQAFAAGAAAVIVGDIGKLGDRPGFEVANARILLSRLSAFAYNYPSNTMQVIGITGTNGKTTTNWMLYHALKALGKKPVRIGTLGYEASTGEESKETLTTPSPQDIQRILALSKEAGCDSAVLEVSSHALHQHRVEDVSFDACAFTNITHDHLDYHRTFEEYFKAKQRMFELLRISRKERRVFCSNLSNPEGQKVAKDFASSFEVDASFGYEDRAPIQIVNTVQKRTTSEVSLRIFGEQFQVETCFLGTHNAENLAATAGVLVGLGYKADEVVKALGGIPPVPGRLEPIESKGIATFVDYAHSPDALERVMQCLKDIPHSKFIVVFGCGGDRDWRKRSVMGDIANRLADYVVVTTDNPRTEDPQKIIDDILQSGLKVGLNCSVIPDRAAAIREALSIATENDVVLIAGKGHEDYQIVGQEKHFFSDQEEIRKFFANIL